MSENHPIEIKSKRIKHDSIIYSINEEERTACLISCKGNSDHIIIPRSIKQESKEYDITSILENAFNQSQIKIVQFSSDSKLQKINKNAFSNSSIKRIKIPPSITIIEEYAFYCCSDLEIVEIPNDSKLRTIEKEAFSFSAIESIAIPSELIELKEGWCVYTANLTKIEVSQQNRRYRCYEDKMIIGKTNIDQDNYDCLVFCVRDITNITIPNFIEHICSYSFDGCKQLDVFEFENDSKLQTIDIRAFLNSSILNITIPSSVTFIGEKAFYNCDELEWIVIPNDSKLRTIDKNAFAHTLIESIVIPSELIELKEGWCSNTSEIIEIEVSQQNKRYCCYDDIIIFGKTNIDQDNYDCLVFCVRDITNITIPNFIKHICSYSFSYCSQLEEIEFQNDSKLQIIGNHAFSNTAISSIIIPSSVTIIGDDAFYNCTELVRVEIPNDSKLRTISKNAFFHSLIESITIPSELIELKEGWCAYTTNLTKIEVSQQNRRYRCYEDKMIIGKTNIDQDNYDCLVFCVRDITNITIPNFIEHICSYSFDGCKQLERIEFQNDSKLQTIDICAFSNSLIKSITIPSSVTFIGERSFLSCTQLKRFEIPSDSKLQKIDKYVFCHSLIESISIPSSVTEIEATALSFCRNLLIIEMNNAEMISFIQDDSVCSKKTLLMIPVRS